MVRHRISLIIILVLFVGAPVCFAKQAVTAGETHVADGAQAKAFDALKAKFDKADYLGARADSAKFVEAYPGSELCPEAQYLVALSYLREANETAARQELEKFIKKYPNSTKVAEASATLRALEARRFQEMLDAQEGRETELEAQNRKLNSAVEAMRMTQRQDKIYIVVDVQADMVMVKYGAATLYAFPCATGKGEGYLAATGGIAGFYTPRGKHTIIKKEQDPVWHRPNWYWLERGEEVPEGITMEERAVHGSLGKYKLDIGDQFYIHGHPGGVKPGKYTHGCIRVNDADLELLWKITEVGTEVYIF